MAINDTTNILKKSGVEIEGGEAVSDLEKKFREISGSTGSPQADAAGTKSNLAGQIEELENLKSKAEKNLSVLKEKIKGDLEGLKNIKDTVEGDLARTKELETVIQKIRTEIEKIQNLAATEATVSKEVKDLEKEIGS